MLHIQKRHIFSSTHAIIDKYFTNNTLFFDIETTGFSPNTSSVYLIGTLTKDGEHLVIDQFFATAKEEEQEILRSFHEMIQNYSTIISFNGLGFDIPFLEAKNKEYSISEAYFTHTFIDIYKEIKKSKHLLKLENYKQKTIEKFLGVSRDDQFSGGELIPIYEAYTKHHDKESEEYLLLHNYEDVIGMLDLLPALSYTKNLQGSYSIASIETSTYLTHDGDEAEELIITLNNKYTVPSRASYSDQCFYYTMHKDTTKIRIPIFEGELKYFYTNFKDYYYLPKEDMAIHKSVATFVDKEYREKAKSSNCYTRKFGRFIPQTTTIQSPIFLKEYKDKISYFELTKDFIESEIMLKKYINHILQP